MRESPFIWSKARFVQGHSEWFTVALFIHVKYLLDVCHIFSEEMDGGSVRRKKTPRSDK